MNEVVQGVRNGKLTSLLAALFHDSARLYIARHVLVEMERDLPDFAAGRGVDPTVAVAHWHGRYLPYLNVVDVPSAWGKNDTRVAAVADRHLTDLPTAHLAVALAPCHGLIEDPDLTENGFGNANWLPVTHASANHAEMEFIASALGIPTVLSAELVKAAARALGRLPDWAHLVLTVAGTASLYWLQNDDRAKQSLRRVQAAVRNIVDFCAPIATQLLVRDDQARETWHNNVVYPSDNRSLSEQLARLLALADQPMTASELAKMVNTPGSLRDRGTAIRAQLREHSAFTEVSRGRWRFGEPASRADALIHPLEVGTWIRRAHGMPPLPSPGQYVA